jgi:murein DD-endopeptidase MepM/ murein hydrolase activator NlpD
MAASGLATVLALGVVSVPLAHADDLHDQQEKVEKQIDDADHALEDSSARLQRAYGALEDARARLADAKSQLETARTKRDAAIERDRQMQEQLEIAQARLEQAELDLDQGQADLEEQRGAVTDMITEIYQQGDPQLQAFSSMLQAEDAADLTWTQEGQSVMVGRETRAYDQLRAAEVLLEVRQAQLADAEAEVAVRREEAAEHLVETRELTAQARTAREQVRTVVNERRDAKAAAAAARARDMAALRRLKAQEQAIKEKIARAAAATTGGYRGASGGFLGWPVQGGYVTSPFGYRTHPIYGYYGLHNGTDFGGGCGLPLVAAASGKVVAKYFSSVYGNRLFVYVGRVNGKNLTIVYNHAASYGVGVGQQVSRGQVVGSVGDTGWSTACHLHFTVLADGRPVNPMNYL